ncbi:alpha/beta hydrolase [Streptomyces sp. TS71-3]|uniref:alpha/beta hydrolase n=1 Tax=Streptomyces sp. TS71-3 TaxID=2733862 RepID=UPI001B2143AF|nr:alpha/beta hydrolase [Streptomyces sp. TS71-3]GHJ36866.1 hypothetical protein Sm713_24750 [Streptomyces sp. TS71-3]
MSGTEDRPTGRTPTQSREKRRPSWLTRTLSVLAVPLVPFYGAFLSYFIYHPPRRPYHRVPDDFDLPVTEAWVPFGKGRSLHVWLAPGDSDRVVVVGHGIGLSKSATLGQAKFLHDAGYTVALFDHRNHGRSSTDRAFWGLAERFTDDVALVVEHVRALGPYADARFAVFGFSFSAFPSLFVLKRPESRVDAIVCDSGPAMRIPPLFRNFVNAKGVPAPAPLRTEPALSVLSRVFGFLGTAMLQGEWPPPAEDAYLRAPLLFVAGEDDRVIPLEGVRAVAAEYPKAEVCVLPGTDHLQGIKSAPDEYRSRVLDFVKRALG